MGNAYRLFCVIEQPFVNWEQEATPDVIGTYLRSGGFVKVPVIAGEKDTGEWHNPKTGIHLVDVRGDNIVMARGDDDLLRPVVLDVPIRISHPERAASSRRCVERRSLISRLHSQTHAHSAIGELRANLHDDAGLNIDEGIHEARISLW
jgi:hypothetical protein